MLSTRTRELLTQIASGIVEAQRPVRILRGVAWDESVRRDFFARGASDLPKPGYTHRLDVPSVVGRFDELRAQVRGDNELERLLRETCDSYILAARMLGAVGTKKFYRYSCELYGRPTSVTCDGKTTNLALAKHFDAVITQYADKDLGPEDVTEFGAEEAAVQLGARLQPFFDGHTIRIELDDSIASDAVAGVDVIRLKRGVSFSKRDIDQLQYHEGHVHIATALNGRAQPVLPFFGHSSPRTTTTQEGLAIFTEFTEQVMDIERIRRLTDRILAVHMSENGADFIELYRFFRDHGHAERQAFDCARRVVRGGLVSGGAPFTKDVCYLDGLLRVSNFLRVAITKGHPDYVKLLFIGKLELDDIPLVAHLAREGLVLPPRYLPRWAQDLPFLTAYMSFSAFLNQTDLVAERRYYEEIIDRAAAEWSIS